MTTEPTIELSAVKARYVVTIPPGTKWSGPAWTKGDREISKCIIELEEYHDQPFEVWRVNLSGSRLKKDGTPYNETLAWPVYGKERDAWLSLIGFDLNEAVRMLHDRIGPRP
jgi:hypothetical protein